MQNIKQLKAELKRWGRYQSQQEFGRGYSSKSNVEQMRLCLLAGGAFGGVVVESEIPQHLSWIDNRINQLSKDCIKAIRFKYVLKLSKSVARSYGFETVRSYEFWLLKAENALFQA